MAEVVSLPQSSVQALVARSGLNDDEITASVNAALAVPYVRPGLVGLWRAGIAPDPAPALLELLERLSRRVDPAGLVRAS